ncbi:hypothetical protein HDV06_004578 [Boothiomyces sp. JEL0866]|nr:hypothetical protein HDV06_004578 [Boothiomyces sp. JEL0866]
MKFTFFALASSVLSQTALDVVLNSPVHKVLASLATPNVVAALNSTGPLTLFAPTDAAFGKLSADTLAAVKADTKLLESILTYHVIPGVAYDPAKVTDADTFAPTAQGETIEAVKANGGVTLQYGINTSSSVTASVKATNGIVHVVDTVLIPPTTTSKTAIAAKLNDLVAALQKVGLVGAVDTTPGITVFAPLDSAFDKLNAFASANGLTITDDLLKTVLLTHVVKKVIYAKDIVAAGQATVNALSGAPITALYKDNVVTVSGEGSIAPAKVVVADVLVANGVVHVIDQVILPSLKASTPQVTSNTYPQATTQAPVYTNAPPAYSSVLSSAFGFQPFLFLAAGAFMALA